MASKKVEEKDVKLILQNLHRQIDSLKEKVEELCQSTGCLDTHVPTTRNSKTSLENEKK